MSDEEAIFQDDSVTVTNARAVLNGTTYAMRNITSVRLTMTPGPWHVPAFFAGLMFFLFFVFISKATEVSVFFGVVGSVCAFWAYYVRHTSYSVVIGTSGSEVSAVTTFDVQWAAKVVNALNQAIIARG